MGGFLARWALILSVKGPPCSLSRAAALEEGEGMMTECPFFFFFLLSSWAQVLGGLSKTASRERGSEDGSCPGAGDESAAPGQGKVRRVKNTEARAKMWAKYPRHSAADGGGFRTQILRFFQPETQNYARIPRSVPTGHMVAR